MARKGKLKKRKTIVHVERPVRTRAYKYFILIACEDQKGEPYYFGKFKKIFDDLLPSETVFISSWGTGRNSSGVVEFAIEERLRMKELYGKEVDQTWAVFDKDDLDLTPGNRKNFINAFKKGVKDQVKIAYSNECFELWLLMHLDEVNHVPSIPRYHIYQRLEESAKKIDENFKYRHGDNAIIDLIWEKGDREKAKTNAKKLDNHHKVNDTSPIDANPNTLVYKLVEELENLYRYYSYTPY